MVSSVHSIAVVIPTYNRRAILERTLNALADQTRRDFHIVVVDDGSTDDTWEWLQARAKTEKSAATSPSAVTAAAEHLHPMTLSDLFARQRLVGRNLRSLLSLHPELAGTPLLSPCEPPRWFAVGKRLIPPLVPLLSAADGAGLALGKRILNRVLMCAYYLGQEEN